MKVITSSNQVKVSGIICLIVLAFILSVIAIAQSSVKFLSFEAENGSALSGASSATDSNASGGSYLAFNGATSPPPSGDSFLETFDNNQGLQRFRWGVYSRAVGYREMDQVEPFNGADNNSIANADWTGDHDMNCGSPDTQRPLNITTIQDKTGANGWQPLVNFHVKELIYSCKDHFMSSMGPASGFDIIWIGPDRSFNHVDSVKFKVNLTDLGSRKWWKVGVVSDSLFNSFYGAGWNGAVRVRGIVLSDVGAADVNGIEGSDRLIATWGGGASAGYPGCLKIGNTQTGICTGQNQDKATRFPISLIDNKNGTTTFTVNGTALTRPGSFPPCPCHVILYDQNYTPDKDGIPIGHTWHWDDIQVN